MNAFLFGTTAFVSALLLFLLEPLVGRMVLPLLGGSAAVWTTCLVVFQALLLLAYAWSHLLIRLPRGIGTLTHLAVLLVAVAALPLSLPPDWSPPAGPNPQFRLVGLLLSSVGLLFFALATNAPTLQRWFAASGHPRRNDPYFLYGASNAGSLVGLLLYPIAFEPFFSVTEHRWAWSAGYVAFLFLVLACALQRTPGGAGAAPAEPTSKTPPPGWGAAGRWVWLAFVPSSLTVGCTAYLSSELAPIPLLWVLPLALYLSTFVLSFTGHVVRPGQRWVQLSAALALVVATAHIAGHASNAMGLALHLGALFLVSALCHGRLADSRPAPDHLTSFYLSISFGGVLGGLFNALVAPEVFHTALEYPLVLVAASLAFAASTPSSSRAETLVRLMPVAAALIWLLGTPVPHPSVALLIPFGALALGLFRRPTMRFAVCGVAALLFLGVDRRSDNGGVVVERSFYSVLRVAENYEPGYRALVHGATVHGMQAYEPSAARRAVTYYAADGPIGQVFLALAPRLTDAHVGVVGLGAGELAVYARAGQEWTFFEIDPLVEHIARRNFSYLRDASAPPAVIIGDGRRSLMKASPGSFDLLVLDAFSSDAIPVHLLTQEAIRLYQSRLRPGGALAVHISNRFVDLAPLLAGTAQASGLCGLDQIDSGQPDPSSPARRRPSHWVLLASSCAALSPFVSDPRWTRLIADGRSPVWSDERADLLTVVRWSSVLAGSTR
jgi:hypothetical protein